MSIFKITLTIFVLVIMASIALAETSVEQKVDAYLHNWDNMNPNQRGEAEQQIAQMMLSPDNYVKTCSTYRRLHHSSDYFDSDLLGRRNRVWRYILTHNNWGNNILQQMANELFVAGYSWEAVTVLNYVIDHRLPGNYK